MDLTYFFKGMLRKEEVASAFLAWALATSSRFRQYFFSLIAPREAARLAARRWEVTVEEERTDVKLEGGTSWLSSRIRFGPEQSKRANF